MLEVYLIAGHAIAVLGAAAAFAPALLTAVGLARAEAPSRVIDVDGAVPALGEGRGRMRRARCLLLSFLLFAGSAVPEPARAGEWVSPGETQLFTHGDRCDGTPFQDTVLKFTLSYCDTATGRVEAGAGLTVSAVNLDVSAFSTMFMDFYVTSGPGSGTVLDATVSADVDWNGILFGAGALGAGASVKVEMLLVDDETGVVSGRSEIVNQLQDSAGLKGLDIGGTRFSGSRTVSFAGKVVRGHDHSIRLTVTCEAAAGLVGLEVGCFYANDVLGLGLGDRYVKWNTLSVTVERDLFEELAKIQTKLDLMMSQLEQIDETTRRSDVRDVEENLRRCIQLESLRLPRSQGGQAEDVRDLVAARIAQFTSLGSENPRAVAVTNAQRQYENGVELLEAGDFASAYNRFCSAYSNLRLGGPTQ